MKIKRRVNKLCRRWQQRRDISKQLRIRRRVRSRDFSIISNNCWAGRVYQYLDMPYLSPTAGLYFFPKDYLRFVSDLRKYLSMPLHFIPAEKSAYYDELKRRKQLDRPIGLLGDVEIVFLHYHSEAEALEKWTRRSKRVNYHHIILKFSRMNQATEEDMAAFDALPFTHKILLDNRKNSPYSSALYWKGYDNMPQIGNDSTLFPGNLNVPKMLNRPAVEYPAHL